MKNADWTIVICSAVNHVTEKQALDYAKIMTDNGYHVIVSHNFRKVEIK